MAESQQAILKDLKGIRERYNLKDSDEKLELTARFMAILTEGPGNPIYGPLMELIEKSRPVYEGRG